MQNDPHSRKPLPHIQHRCRGLLAGNAQKQGGLSWTVLTLCWTCSPVAALASTRTMTFTAQAGPYLPEATCPGDVHEGTAGRGEGSAGTELADLAEGVSGRECDIHWEESVR